MLNLVTAVIVENAFSDSKSEDLELAVRLEREKEEELEDLTLGSHDIGDVDMIYVSVYNDMYFNYVQAGIRLCDMYFRSYYSRLHKDKQVFTVCY